MRRVHLVRTKGERIDAKGQPLRKEGDELQSWIRALAREHIPIWISDFRSVDLAPRKERVWVEVFEKTGQWPHRHTTWLDMRVKPMESSRIHHLKLLADDFSEQEIQGSFESVRTNDILTKSLGNAEHLGRIRGQSKFVKQSQYSNIVQSPRVNAEVSEVKQQLAALERIVQALCAKHDINRDTIAEETIAPTVDQYNSFRLVDPK
ncbi:hypothetical protein TIFTF001_041345 [Ficus carica]|uniref:Transposase n=1 Tax=Ficus carica TaxID=3494 RepID=A0AA88CTV5_FICCA|nr:hypothetical protein TIFTF001_041345 [Ficus carica]